MIDNYEQDISYPYYIRARNGIDPFHKMIDKLLLMNGYNLLARCLSCHDACHDNRMYCNGCYHLLKFNLKDSSSFCN